MILTKANLKKYDCVVISSDHEKECDFLEKVFKKFSGRVETILDLGNNLFFIKMGFLKDEHYPVAERIARQGLYLPSGLT